MSRVCMSTIAACVFLASAGVQAKLPPPTPEEVAARDERRAAEEARLAQEKAALERVQDRIAERYRRDRAAQPANGVRREDLPQSTKQQPGTAPPEGDRRQSAEAHSAPAK